MLGFYCVCKVSSINIFLHAACSVCHLQATLIMPVSFEIEDADYNK